MPAAANPQPMLDELKAHIAGLIGKKAEDIDRLDGRLTEALELVAKKASTDEVLQLKTLATHLQGRVDELEAERKASGFGDEAEADFATLVARHESYKAVLAGTARRTERIIVPSMAKAATPVSSALLGSDPYYRPGVIPRLEPSVRFIDLIRVVPVPGVEVYKFRRETARSQFGRVHTNANGAKLLSDTTVTLDDVEGLMVGTKLRIFAVGADTFFVTPKITNINTSTKVVTFAAQLGTAVADNAPVVAEYYGAINESGSKPYGILETAEATSTLITFPLLLPVTEQRLNTIPGLRAWGESKLRGGARKNRAWHCMYGNAATYPTTQGAGFMSDTASAQYLWSGGVSKDTRVDAVIRAALKIDSDGQISAVMNKDDWARLLTEKAGDQHYVHTSFGPVQVIDRPGLKAIGGIMVVTDGVMVDGDFLVADFDVASELPDQESAAFSFGYINDQYARNEITARYEETWNHAITQPQAFVRGQWDSQPA